MIHVAQFVMRSCVCLTDTRPSPVWLVWDSSTFSKIGEEWMLSGVDTFCGAGSCV